MTRRELNLDNLEHLDDGRVKIAFQQALARVIDDLQDRPAVGDARKVTLQAELVPEMDDEGNLEEVRVKFQVKDTIPTRKSKVYRMDVQGKDRLVFNDLAPEDDPAQRTLDEQDVNAFDEQP